jgi:hypothetical protein
MQTELSIEELHSKCNICNVVMMSINEEYICKSIGIYQNKSYSTYVCSKKCVDLFNAKKCITCNRVSELKDIEGKNYCDISFGELSCYDKKFNENCIKKIHNCYKLIKNRLDEYNLDDPQNFLFYVNPLDDDNIDDMKTIIEISKHLKLLRNMNDI